MAYWSQYFQLVGGVLIVLGYVPQIIKVYKTKSMKDFSLSSLIMVAVAISCMEVYATDCFVHGQAAMYFVTNTSCLICSIAMIIAFKFVNFYTKGKA